MIAAPWRVAVAVSLLGPALGTGSTVPPDSTASASYARQDVPVRLFLDRPRYAPGAFGHVTVRVGQNGYLLVLYADPNGHVRVAFPLDPGVDARVAAGTDIPIYARGRTDAFTVEDSTGTGTWYAATSKHAFRFDSVAVGGHWDYRAIPRVSDPRNGESELTAFVHHIAAGRFDYDIVTFQVSIYATAAAIAAPTGGPHEPRWPGPWAGPWGGPWGWPGPWLPKPWPGPEPRYDRPNSGPAPTSGSDPGQPSVSGQSPGSGGRAPEAGPAPAPPRAHGRGEHAPARGADHPGDRKPESGPRGPRF